MVFSERVNTPGLAMEVARLNAEITAFMDQNPNLAGEIRKIKEDAEKAAGDRGIPFTIRRLPAQNLLLRHIKNDQVTSIHGHFITCSRYFFFSLQLSGNKKGLDQGTYFI